MHYTFCFLFIILQYITATTVLKNVATICKHDNCCRICTPILAAISDNIHRYLLQRQNIHHKKRAHLIAGGPRSMIYQTAQRTSCRLCVHIFTIPALPLQLLQITHRLQSPLSQGSDTYFLKIYDKKQDIFAKKSCFSYSSQNRYGNF